MLAETPSLEEAVTAIAAYANRHATALTPQDTEILIEVIRRLERLAVQARELMTINNRLWEKEPFTASFDPTTDTFSISYGGKEQRFRLNRADPSVPLKVGSVTSIAAYQAGKTLPRDAEEASLRIELEEKLEGYYQSAHRVLKLLGTVSGLTKVRCIPITRVRNNLIEHPDDGAMYSFGFGSSGPRIKPMTRGKATFNDDGLVPNTRDLVHAIVSGCENGAP